MSWLCVTEALPADGERGRGADDRGGGSDGMTGWCGREVQMLRKLPTCHEAPGNIFSRYRREM